MNLNFDCLKYHFDSGNLELNNFFYTYTLSYIKENLTHVYFLEESNGRDLIGFFTLSCTHLEFPIDFELKKIKIRYIPELLIGQLAVDKKFQKKAYGTYLLTKAVEIGVKVSSETGCRVIIVDALTDLDIINFYKKLGFKFAKTNLSEKILKELELKRKSSYKSIKMYFDLKEVSQISH